MQDALLLLLPIRFMVNMQETNLLAKTLDFQIHCYLDLICSLLCLTRKIQHKTERLQRRLSQIIDIKLLTMNCQFSTISMTMWSSKKMLWMRKWKEKAHQCSKKTLTKSSKTWSPENSSRSISHLLRLRKHQSSIKIASSMLLNSILC